MSSHFHLRTLPLSLLNPNISGLGENKDGEWKPRVKHKKPLRFMKIYNFALEVYDSPSSRIGCWRSCGQQQWELISHEVILQLLFSTARSLNSCNTSFFLAFRISNTRVECCFGKLAAVSGSNFPGVGDGDMRDAPACAPCYCGCTCVAVCSWKWGITPLQDEGITFMMSLKRKVGNLGAKRTDRKREELLRSGTHTGNDGLSTKVRAPCF